MRSLSVLVFFLVACNACQVQTTPNPPPSPTPTSTVPVQPPDVTTVTVIPMDGSAPLPPVVGDVYADACAAMKAAGCAEGASVNCASTIRHADQAGITKVPLACLASAKGAAAVRACGFVTCR